MTQIKVTAVWPESVDEWYGVGVRFEWVGEPPTLPSGRLYANDGSPVAAERRAFEVSLARQVLASPEFAAFFSKPRAITVWANGSDPTPTQARIPSRWSADGYDALSLTPQGGQISWSERDD